MRWCPIVARVGQSEANLWVFSFPQKKWNKWGEQANSHAAAFVPHFCELAQFTAVLSGFGGRQGGLGGHLHHIIAVPLLSSNVSSFSQRWPKRNFAKALIRSYTCNIQGAGRVNCTPSTDISIRYQPWLDHWNVVPGYLDWDLESGGSPHNVGLPQKICQVSPKSGRIRPSVLPEDWWFPDHPNYFRNHSTNDFRWSQRRRHASLESRPLKVRNVFWAKQKGSKRKNGRKRKKEKKSCKRETDLYCIHKLQR